MRPPSALAGDRVSVPFFFEPNYDAVITPLPPTTSNNADDSCDGAEPWPGQEEGEAVRYGDHLLRKVATNFPALDHALDSVEVEAEATAAR